MAAQFGGIGPGCLRLGHFVPGAPLYYGILGRLIPDMFPGPPFFRYFTGLDLALK
jgi:hypothetical protein